MSFVQARITSGSGMDGMITSRDVENFAGSKAGATAAPVAPSFVMPPGNAVPFFVFEIKAK